MRACARCGQEFNPRPTGVRTGRPRTKCDRCRTPNKLGITAADCRRCGQKFNPLPTGSKVGRRKTQCNSCRSGKNGHNINYAPAQKHIYLCYQCGLDFVANKAGQRFCSHKCMRKAHQNKKTVLRRVARTCKTCNQPLEYGVRKLVCLACMKAKERDRSARKSHSRRATGKLPSKSQVVQRWGNRCHLCEKKIDLGLSGKNPLGFTFDHVIPVSMGGTNDAENIRPAHWICNIRRGNRGPVQLDLGMCG